MFQLFSNGTEKSTQKSSSGKSMFIEFSSSAELSGISGISSSLSLIILFTKSSNFSLSIKSKHFQSTLLLEKSQYGQLSISSSKFSSSS
ncbi:MAG: hypothetical protein LBC61_07840 [Candidatus Peribacteria bacterium]|nr:hypothetical protein [Candidatus Peribacteria bacterium]